jgi:GNAT superfamily N-acetyltransferase
MLQEKAVEIIRARKEDYNEIITVSNTCFRDHPEDLDTLRQLLSISTTFVAKIEGKIVGTVSYTNLKESEGEVIETPQCRKNKMYCIWGVAVLPKYRNIGIGTNLVHARAEKDMYRKKAKGYIGNAFPEEVAQWWARRFGVRLRGLALDRLMTFGVPFEKRFSQDGFFENLKTEFRKDISYLLGRTYTRAKTALLRKVQKNKPR